MAPDSQAAPVRPRNSGATTLRAIGTIMAAHAVVETHMRPASRLLHQGSRGPEGRRATGDGPSRMSAVDEFSPGTRSPGMRDREASLEFVPVILTVQQGRRVTVPAIQLDDKEDSSPPCAPCLTSPATLASWARRGSLGPSCWTLRHIPEPAVSCNWSPWSVKGAEQTIVAGARYSSEAGSTDCELRSVAYGLTQAPDRAKVPSGSVIAPDSRPELSAMTTLHARVCCPPWTIRCPSTRSTWCTGARWA
jgi:hypothetical protein